MYVISVFIFARYKLIAISSNSDNISLRLAFNRQEVRNFYILYSHA